jgi:hypothetical protein
MTRANGKKREAEDEARRSGSKLPQPTRESERKAEESMPDLSAPKRTYRKVKQSTPDQIARG